MVVWFTTIVSHSYFYPLFFFFPCYWQVSWRRENYAVLPTGGSQYRGNILTIPTVSKDDRGTYYCVAENGVGKGKRRNIAVEVEFSPVITVPRWVYAIITQWQWRKLSWFFFAIFYDGRFLSLLFILRPRLGQALQYDMDLECHVVAYPPPAITWWKDDVQLSNNQHYRYIQNLILYIFFI